MRLLIVAASEDARSRAAQLEVPSASVQQVTSVAAATAVLRDWPPIDAVLIDSADSAAFQQIAVAGYGVAVGSDLDRTMVRAAGARGFLALPTDPALAIATDQSGPELVSDDRVMQQLLAVARQVAPSGATVLITGESGTGKEMLARYVHQHSRRGERCFVSVNCAAIPENLLEAELFGHEKGAFTGALTRRIGRFEEANGGTLLLDEISEMAPHLQAKLLRAIQEREIDRLGSATPTKIDIRLIATSNRDLETEVSAGRFREDLWFLLNVIQLDLPPLRARPADIATLARHFAAKYAAINGARYRPLASAAMALLQSHHWRGNVRELENCIHRAVLLASGDEIGPDDLVLQGGRAAEGNGIDRSLVGRTIAEVECDLILKTLRYTRGNRAIAAAILGISVRTLRNKLRQYGDEGLPVPPPSVGRVEPLAKSA
jgi:DNA-binding NtrC family response regulator